jgi:hypothetical protein
LLPHNDKKRARGPVVVEASSAGALLEFLCNNEPF